MTAKGIESGSDDEYVSHTSFRFSAIEMIESLGPNDYPKTGQDLLDTVLRPIQADNLRLRLEFQQPRTEASFREAMAQVRQRTISHQTAPILHLETHGNEYGLELASGDVVEWRSLISLLADINQACRMNLTVVAAMCQGWFLTTHLMPSDRAPVFMVIGPTSTITPTKLLKSLTNFYQAAFTAHDGGMGTALQTALDAMNSAEGYGRWGIKPGFAEILFCRVFRRYVEEYGGSDTLRDRENRLVAAVVRERGLNLLQAGVLREEVRKDLGDHPAAYEQLRNRFLMLDLFPGNAPRFGLSYELCVRRRASA